MIRLGAMNAAVLVMTAGLAVGADRLADSVQSLAALQDRMAAGDSDAERIQSQLIAQIETDLRNASEKLAAGRDSSKALSLLLFSGGNPNLVEARAEPAAGGDDMTKVFNGALAYARADQKAALIELQGLKLESLPQTLGGRVALVRAILMASTDLGAALEDLRTAQRLMPGTLVEEGALRRCVAFAGKLGRLAELNRCAARYVRRFPLSIYWPDFSGGLVDAYARQPDEEAERVVDSLRNALAGLPASRRSILVLGIARAALLRGKLKITARSSAWGNSLAFAESSEMTRAKLYAAAADIVAEHGAGAALELEHLDRDKLDAADQALLEQARLLRQEINRKPAMSVAEAKQALPPDQHGADKAAAP